MYEYMLVSIFVAILSQCRVCFGCILSFGSPWVNYKICFGKKVLVILVFM